MENSTTACATPRPDGGDRGRDWTEEVNERFQQASEEIRTFDRQLRSFVRESPFVALAAAVAGGFLFGRLLGRR